MAKFYYGGQAVIEGVMMRGRGTVAMAVRKPEQDIYLYEERLPAKLYKSPLFKLPFLRGMLMLWEMLVIGTRMMNIATNVVFPDEETPTDAKQQAPNLPETPFNPEVSAVPSTDAAQTAGQKNGWSLALTVLISLGFAIGLFFVLPLFLANGVQWLVLTTTSVQIGWGTHVVEGVIRLALLIGYLFLIGMVPDIQRVFGYHGAEHKAINAMEHGHPLDVEHVRQASRLHTRCGTGFLLIVVVLSIIAFTLFPGEDLWSKVIWRIVLIPLVAGVGYELLRLGAAGYKYAPVRWLMYPSLMLQNLTTREPDDGMIECAITALERVLVRDGQEHPGMQTDFATLPPLPEREPASAS